MNRLWWLLCRWLREGPGGGGQSGLGWSSLCLSASAQCQLQNNLRRLGTTRSLQHEGQGGVTRGEGGPQRGGRALLGPPELLALCALHTLQPHPELWQEDLSMSNPLSGSQILRPCGVLPCLRNPCPAQGKHGSLVVWAQHWEPGAGQPSRCQSQESSSVGVQGLGGAHSPTEVRVNLLLPPPPSE